jgi:aspartyl-tRNA(Asn)/glutamyl-tRNA(Gln) amidotransferase subunit A
LVPGGSSGGSAAAVVADLAQAALGSDTGGSIRQPAALCGCVGFKPSYGAVSRYGLISMASSLDVIGPLTRSVADARLLFDVMRGRDERDGTSVEINNPKSETRNSLKGIRIGIPQEYFLPGIDSGVEGAVQAAIKQMKSFGATIVPIGLPHTEYGLATYYVIMPAEASSNLSRYDGVRFRASNMAGSGSLDEGYVATRGRFGDEVKRRILIGTYVLSAGYYDAFYRQAQRARGLITRDFEQAFEKVDCLVAPTTPTQAWAIGEKQSDPLEMYLSDIFTVNDNLAGIPAISIPCGASDDLPVGLQLMAARGNDRLLLDIAQYFETHYGHPS